MLLSLVVALTVVPLAARGVDARASGRRAPAPPWYAAGYARALAARAAPAVARAGALALALLAAGAVAARAVGTGFLPDDGRGRVRPRLLPARRHVADRHRRRGAQDRGRPAARLPEVATYSRRTGAELGPAAATEVSRGDIMVRLKPRARARTGRPTR